jgi:hypothetical protein
MNDELERMWKDACMIYVPESTGLSKTTKNPSQCTWFSGRDLNPGRPVLLDDVIVNCLNSSRRFCSFYVYFH